MTTPDDIENEVNKLRRLRQLGGTAHVTYLNKEKRRLYVAVLREIAAGEVLDPRSVAAVALEAEDV